MNQTDIILSCILGLLLLILVVVVLKKEKYSPPPFPFPSMSQNLSQPVVVDRLMYSNQKSRLLRGED